MTYGYYPEITKLLYVNDDDGGGNGIIIFDEIIDVTEGRRTRSIIITDSNHIILSSIQPETLLQRFTPASLVDPPPAEEK